MYTEEIAFDFIGQTLLLSSLKAIYWKETGSLLLADVHLGKAGHFRKAGIPLPSEIHRNDLKRLDQLIARYQPEKLLLLGDLFHSDKNAEWSDFLQWRKGNSAVAISLILGNHDVIPARYYTDIDIAVMEKLSLGPFTLTHHPSASPLTYNIAGHIHPGVHLKGRSRQCLKLPCFYFGKRGGLLPAFGNFTGQTVISMSRGDKIFAITPKAVMPVQ